MMGEGSTFEYEDGKREMLDADRAKLLLSKLLEVERLSSLECVNLSGKSIGDSASSVVGEALALVVKHSPLVKLSLADIIAGRPEDEALRVLNVLSESIASEDSLSIKCLDLSDNALGAKGVAACEALLTKAAPNLNHLYFCNNGLAADAGSLITKILTCGSTRNTQLETLHFFNNLLESAGAIALSPLISSSPELVDFRFSSLRVSSEGAEHISKALLNCSKLESLDLSDNTFGLNASKILAKALQKMSALKTLNMRDTSIGDSGAKLICKTLVQYCPQIEKLDLSANELTVASVKGGLAVAVSGLPKLKVLLVEENELGSKGGSRLAEAIVLSSSDEKLGLEELSLNVNEMGDRAAQSWMRVGEILPHLKKLGLNGNAFGEECVEELKRVFDDSILGSMSDNDEDLAEEEESEEEDEEEENEASSNAYEEETGDDDIDDLISKTEKM
uniref:Ran GTPase-activating protein 1 n=1 Tax=Timspurckia oligopyrenoides TaxID=708627 RepID=A0A7S0ZAA0_9RHOD|mmetsp:Transcript_1002/g.1896  ORF Transcript_1002/g.1896 Transcript_1002/m.1896 type:complete len:449 (+) Transcript_1002:52-1398(+)